MHEEKVVEERLKEWGGRKKWDWGVEEEDLQGMDCHTICSMYSVQLIYCSIR